MKTYLPVLFVLSFVLLAQEGDCGGMDADEDGWTTTDGDCDDTNADIHPGATEVCDEMDNNCDDSIDEGCDDADGDGYSSVDGDCDDANAAIYPGATEVCDGVDNDCNDLTDEDTLGTDEACPGFDCLEVYENLSDPSDGLYWIDPGGSAPFEAYCDMTTNGGGWTLVARAHNGSTSEHRNQDAVGVLTSPEQETTAKLSDTVINLLRRGDNANSILIQRTADGNEDYFRESRDFNALGYTDSINQVYDTYEDALALEGVCSGSYNSTYHTGLVGWTCYEHMIYGDNPGMRSFDYQAGAVWVKALSDSE